MTPRKKLIEVALPLDAINAESAREKSIRHGHPSTLHLWWARRPLAAARAMIFAQMVDDPSSHPERFPTEEAQEAERQRLFRLIEQLVLWENTTNEKILDQAREEIWKSWHATCAENQGDPHAKELYDPEKLPAFHDPFSGGGALPLEAQRFGLESYAGDLNPVAVLICKAMIEIPPKFAGLPPVNPASRKDKALLERKWCGAQGLAEDVRYYGQWMRDEAEKRIGHLYPKINVTADMAKERPDLKPYIGKDLTVIAWLWARTVKSPNPAFANVEVPLVSTFMLSKNAGKEAYVEPLIESGGYRFTVKLGKPKDAEAAKNGTKLARGANFRCLMSGTPIEGDYIKAEGTAGRMRVRLMAIVAEGARGRIYLAPTAEQEATALKARPEWKPDGSFVEDPRAFTPFLYGLKEWHQLFTDRQLVALTTFSDLVGATMARIRHDAVAAGLSDDGKPLRGGGTGATAYSDAICVYLALGINRTINSVCSLVKWNNARDQSNVVFARNALPMLWDFADVNPFADAAGDLSVSCNGVAKALAASNGIIAEGHASQQDAATQSVSRDKLVSTDPPYYDNVPYADLSDFFYVWLRRSLRPVFPDLFVTLAVPKAGELVAFPYRHKQGKLGAEAFFLDGMTRAMRRLVDQAHPAFPVTIYYAFKQSESDSDTGTTSTGWETFLDAVIRAGFGITGTWPVRTERPGRMRDTGSNALASSIVLVCRKRPVSAPIATRREFVAALKAELPEALRHLQRSNIAPVDLAQAAIGPGMAVYTRYAKVVDAEGKPLSVREALALINQTLDEALAEQEGDFDADSRWALAWFEQSGFAQGEYGVAETLSKAKNTSVSGMVDAGILTSKGGKVRLLRPNELPADWDPATDSRFTAWESVHHLVRTLEAGGENAAAELVAKIGSQAEIARELAYRLYTVCERKKRAQEALSYNGLVQSWPEIARLARESGKPLQSQPQLFNQE
jgi:putative DNA methylase